MDSSPDLSLKLRRGSSDSRDTFYMDFAQGIDSDIEEVDNSGIKREPQQTPTPPPPIVDVMDLPSASVLPPPPLPSMLQHQPLPTLSEQDDLPPSPPLQQDEQDNGAGSIDLASPLVSPTTSVLEMIPPPPLPPSPPPIPMEQERQPQLSPSAETEDEGDEQNDGDVDEDYDEKEEEDEKSTPPPPLPPLPETFAYIQTSEGTSPPMTKSPSTSPSPPVTPPPCPQMICLDKIVSPPMSHVPPLTPPSESDQSQPSSPPPLPPHPDMRGVDDQMMSIPVQVGSTIPDVDQFMPSTPPPGFTETDDMIAAAVAATLDSVSPDLIQEVLEGGGIDHQYIGEDVTSLNDDESTTITTPPTNGYSASSIVVPQGELEHDYGLNLADIPPPACMELQDVDVDDDDDMEVEENTREKTLTSEPAIDDVITDEHTTAEIPVEEEEEPSQSPTTVSISGSPKKSSVGRVPSRVSSRSARGSVASQPGSIKSGSASSVAQSIASAISAAATVGTGAIVSSPPASIKSIKSQNSIRSTYSSKKESPPTGGRIRSPPAVESPISIRSSSGVRSPLAKSQSPVGVSSPPRLCSPPLRQKEAELIEKADRHR